MSAAAGRELWCASVVFEPFEVPGYDVLAPLGGLGRTWKAIAGADRSRVVLRCVRGGEKTRQRFRQEAALWGSVSAAHVVAVRDVVTVEPDLTVVVSDYASGGGLDALLARRGSLDDGEIVTLVVPLAETLAAAHGRGLAHGRLSTGNIVFVDDGRPMLADIALSCSADEGARPDVDALVEVATSALGGRRTGAVFAVLATPHTSAAALAAALRAAAPAQAIALHKSNVAASESSTTAQTQTRRRSIGVAAVVVVALVAGVAWGHRDNASATRLAEPSTPTATPAPQIPTTQPLPTTQPPSTSHVWWGVVQRLEEQRARAYTAALAQQDLRPVGLHLRLQSVQLLSHIGDSAVVRVIDGWTSYSLVDADGQVTEHRPAMRSRTDTLLLHHTASGWRLRRVLP